MGPIYFNLLIFSDLAKASAPNRAVGAATIVIDYPCRASFQAQSLTRLRPTELLLECFNRNCHEEAQRILGYTSFPGKPFFQCGERVAENLFHLSPIPLGLNCECNRIGVVNLQQQSAQLTPFSVARRL